MLAAEPVLFIRSLLPPPPPLFVADDIGSSGKYPSPFFLLLEEDVGAVVRENTFFRDAVMLCRRLATAVAVMM